MYWPHTRTSCDYCEGDYEFEVEGPDYSVGLRGYGVTLSWSTDSGDDVFKTHEEDCPVRHMKYEEIEQIEQKLSHQVAAGDFDVDTSD